MLKCPLNRGNFNGTLARAVDNLRKMTIEYNSHLHPRVRQGLVALKPDGRRWTPKDSANNKRPTRQRSGSGNDYPEVFTKDFLDLAEVYDEMTDRSKFTVGAIADDLMNHEAETIPLIIWAAAEQFDDATIRSADSPTEFKRLATAYAPQIWPAAFADHEKLKNLVAQLHPVQAKLNDALRALNTVT